MDIQSMDIQCMDKTFWLQLITALAAFLTAIVALFQDCIRNRLLGPKLEISVNETPDLNQEGGEQVWYHHLDLCNKRSAMATNTMVFLTKVEEIRDRGPKYIWHGERPLTWMYSEDSSFQFRNIGSPYSCDIVSVMERNGLRLMITHNANNLSEHHPWRSAINLQLSIMVKYDQSSFERKVIIHWDGQWEKGKDEMSEHLKIRMEPKPKKFRRCKKA